MPLELFILVLLMTYSCHANNEKFRSTIIDTPQGPVNGLKTVNLLTRKDVFEFRGIPYGKAERFKRPEPVEKWTDILDATEFGAGCAQPVTEGAEEFSPSKMSEDCLFLNIYVPGDRATDEKMTVMVWIHGGGMQIGFSNQYDGGFIATEGNVIVVTINYRLSIFGFLALDHPAAKGNYGLWDQKLALQWVQENIEAFGGDPKSVTIFGESAGGWSTSMQALLPSNKGLFNRVIAQSGTVGETSFLKKKMIEDNIQDLSNKTACPASDMDKFVDCLREKSMQELAKSTKGMDDMPDDRFVYHMQYQQVIDGDLVQENPLRRLTDQNSEEYNFFNSLDFLVGTTSNEGVYIHMVVTPKMQELYSFNISEGIPSKCVREVMIDPFVETYYNNDPEVKTKFYNFYEREDIAEQALFASYFAADVWFNFPTLRILEHHSSGNAKTFHYVFSKPSETPLFGEPPAWSRGVGHGEDLTYFFDIGKFMPSLKELKLSGDDLAFAKRVIRYWTSFAKTGQPDGGVDSVTWKPYEIPERAYLDINVKDDVKSYWNQRMYEMWSTLPFSESDNLKRDEL